MASSDLSTNNSGPVDGDGHSGKPYIQSEQPTSSLQGLDDLSHPSSFLQMGDRPMQQRSWRLREDDVSPSAREYLLVPYSQ